MPPASRLVNPATRVYSSPKPTQPDNKTMGESNLRPQKSSAREAGKDMVGSCCENRRQATASGGSAEVFRAYVFERRYISNRAMDGPAKSSAFCELDFGSAAKVTPFASDVEEVTGRPFSTNW